MTDYSELLARLDMQLTTAIKYGPETPSMAAYRMAWERERAECAAAIRALIAEHDAAVLAERTCLLDGHEHKEFPI